MMSKWHPVYLEPLLHVGPSGTLSGSDSPWATQLVHAEFIL